MIGVKRAIIAYTGAVIPRPSGNYLVRRSIFP
jgi:hypothetical protein